MLSKILGFYYRKTLIQHKSLQDKELRPFISFLKILPSKVDTSIVITVL